VLVLAPAALAEICALGFNAPCRLFDYPNQPGPRKAFLRVDNLCFNQFSDSDEWHENDKVAIARHTFSTESYVGDA
jgi:hypothetical protein